MYFLKDFAKMILEIVFFSRQCAIGRLRDNPSLKGVGYNDNTMKARYSVRPIAGNVQGTVGKFNVIDDTPLPKRKKTT